MKFVIKKEDLYEGIKIVEPATSVKALQPVLFNIYIETVDDNTIKLVATDLDMTVITTVDAQVTEKGRITLPAKTLNEIVSKLNDNLITFEMQNGETNVHITCQKTKFDIIGISADEFPSNCEMYEVDEENPIEVPIKTLIKSVRQAGFAAATYENSNLLSGIVFNLTENRLEVASTDGNRLARVREVIENNKEHLLIIPAKTVNEFVKMCAYFDDETVKIFADNASRIIIKSAKTTTISRLLEGQFPQYNKLVPNECPKNAVVNINQLVSALDRVSVMVNDKTNIAKFEFTQNNLRLTADTPDSGKSEENIDIDYLGDDLTIAFNYKYMLEALKNIESDDVRVGLNTNLTATVLRPSTDDIDFVCLVMPVQIR